MTDFLPMLLEAGSFGLVAFLVIRQFQRLDEHMLQSQRVQASTARVMAELVLQIARVTGAGQMETAESSRLIGELK